MQAALKSFSLDPDPSTLGANPADFATLARLIVGPVGSPGEESFDVTVCAPEWLVRECARVGGILDARHHVIVSIASFDRRALEAWFEARVRAASGESWTEIANKIARLGYWEFEDYRE